MPSLDELRALYDKATPGPWTRDAWYIVGQVPDGRPGGEVIGAMVPTSDAARTQHGSFGMVRGEDGWHHTTETQDTRNAEAIVALHEAFPRLEAVVRAAQAVCTPQERPYSADISIDEHVALRSALAALDPDP